MPEQRRECDYPPCHEPAKRMHAYSVPGPQVALCEEHGAVMKRNRRGEADDFWRWALAMLSKPSRPGVG